MSHSPRLDLRTAATRPLVLIVTLHCLAIASLAIMAIYYVRERGAQAQCVSNLKMIGIGVHSSFDANKRLPPVNSYFPGKVIPSKLGTVLFHLDPFFERGTVWNMFKDSDQCVDMDFDSNHLVLCPSDPIAKPKFPESNYAPNWWLFRNEPGGSRVFADLADGGSNAVAFAERRGVCTNGGGSWTKREHRYGAWVEDTGPFQSVFSSTKDGDNRKWHGLHQGAMNVLMADGAVHAKGANVDPGAWTRLVQVENEE